MHTLRVTSMTMVPRNGGMIICKSVVITIHEE